MKKDTHPDYHLVDVTMTNGDIVQMKTTWGSEGDTLSLDVDPSGHPAWTGCTEGSMSSASWSPSLPQVDFMRTTVPSVILTSMTW